MTGARPAHFRSRFNRVLAVVIWAVCAVLAGVLLLTPGGLAYAASLAPIAAGAAITWIVLWRPHLRVDDDAVVVANITHTVSIPWAAVIHVDTKYSLTVHTPGRRVSVVAAPAPGRVTSAMARRSATGTGVRTGERVRPGDLTTTDSGSAAELVRGRWDQLKEAGRIQVGVADSTPVDTRVDAVAVTTLAVSAALVVLALVLG